MSDLTKKALVVPSAANGLPGMAWRQVREFSALGGDATYFWPRWFVLRAVGVVYLFVFAGVIAQGQALLAPNGLAQLDEFFAQIGKTFPNALEGFLHAPSLFWLNTSTGMIATLGWLGMAAAVALVLNLWPRMALFVCWLVFLSFVSTWRAFSPAQLDKLMLEVALLCLPFAPAGFRPGLGGTSPARPIAVFMVRWLLFRVMFESGLVKLTAGDPHWRDLSAMEVLYETSPFPTILGYLDFQLPHFYHLGEIALTFAAELVAPVVAVFGGRRGRWFAFWTWAALQAGIQLTSNFGWLNTASLGLGVLLLDDQMIRGAADRLGLRKLAELLAAKAPGISAGPAITPWRLHGLRVALGAHFYLTFFSFAKIVGVPENEVPVVLAGPAKLVREFRSANGYHLYAKFEAVRYHVEFAGSNDGGRTWRAYDYKNIPQREDRIGGFIAPWFSRFDATMEIEVLSGRKSPLFPAVAGHLLVRNPRVMALFARDPFPDRPPTMIRMRGYRLAFTDLKTHRETGHYWRREPAGDYLPMMQIDERGQLGERSLATGDAALRSGNYAEAFRIYEEDFAAGFLPAGFRLADMYARGAGGRANPTRAFALYTQLETEGEVGAEHYLGICHEYGVGVPINYAQAASWYQRAADHGYLPGLFSLGTLHANDRIVPRDDVKGLGLLLAAAERATGEDPASRHIRASQPEFAKRLMDRMSPADIAKAKLRTVDQRQNSKPLPAEN
ncbi:MAG: hypothetical protein EXS32_04885 [Opitutus sp.]|nr:hypothetical protein [Opitutus sp.]